MLIPLKGGWKESTWYLCEASHRATNPIHRVLLFTGFLRDGRPGNYSAIFCVNGSYEYPADGELYYLRALRVLLEPKDFTDGSGQFRFYEGEPN